MVQFEPENQREARLILLLMDNYTFVKRLGRGAFATVYEVVNKSLDRTEALKVLSNELTEDQDFLARFKVEAKVCASFSHPNIVTIYESDQVEDLHYFSMTFVNGPPLSRFLKPANAMPEAQICGILAKVADAIHYSHQMGVIHRDLKASNIMLDQASRPFVTDFGIAKSDKALNKTKTGMFIGSPYYVSPEQVDGTQVDHRADIYSLGVCLYALLTHQYPFEGDTAISVMAKRLTHEPIAPDLRKPGLNPDLIRIIKKSLQRNPDDRYSSAAEFAAELCRCCGTAYQPQAAMHSTFTGSIPPKAGEATPGKGKARFKTLLAAVALAALLGGGAWHFLPSIIDRPNAQAEAILDSIKPVADAAEPSYEELLAAQNQIAEVLRLDANNRRAIETKIAIEEKIKALTQAWIAGVEPMLDQTLQSCNDAMAQRDYRSCIQSASTAVSEVKKAPLAMRHLAANQLSEIKRYLAEAEAKARENREQMAARQEQIRAELDALAARVQSHYQKENLDACITSADHYLKQFSQLNEDQQALFASQKKQVASIRSQTARQIQSQRFKRTLGELVTQIEKNYKNRNYDQCIEGAIKAKSRIESLPTDRQAAYAAQKENVISIMYKAERAKQHRESQLHTLERVRRKIDEGALGSALSLLENALAQPGIDDDIEIKMLAEKKRIQTLWKSRPSNIDTGNITVQKVN